MVANMRGIHPDFVDGNVLGEERTLITQRRGQSAPLLAGEFRGSAVSTCTHTWSAPAARCSLTRRSTASSSPQAMIASNSRSLTDVTSSSSEARAQQVVGSSAAPDRRATNRYRPRGLASSSVSSTVCSGSKSGPSPRCLPGLAGVLGRDEIRMGAAGPGRRELQHFGAQRREHPVPNRYRIVGRIDRIQISPLAASLR